TDEENEETVSTMADLAIQLITDSKITNKSFEKLVAAITDEYDGDLALENISEGKLSVLIENGRLKMSPANFNGLRKNAKTRLLLIQKNIVIFIEHIQEYSLEPEDILLLLRSTGVGITDKLLIIVKMPDELITGQHELADLICSLTRNSST